MNNKTIKAILKNATSVERWNAHFQRTDGLLGSDSLSLHGHHVALGPPTTEDKALWDGYLVAHARSVIPELMAKLVVLEADLAEAIKGREYWAKEATDMATLYNKGK